MLILGEIKRLFRCTLISWIHVGESVAESLIDVFEILSNLWHIFRVCSEYVQGMFRVCSEYNIILVIASSSASSVSGFGIFLSIDMPEQKDWLF